MFDPNNSYCTLIAVGSPKFNELVQTDESPWSLHVLITSQAIELGKLYSSYDYKGRKIANCEFKNTDHSFTIIRVELM